MKRFILLSIFFILQGILGNCIPTVSNKITRQKKLSSQKTKIKFPIEQFAWKHSMIPLSPPPPLLGKQMGIIEAPGLKPLGYTMDGKVKVFEIIAQPVEQLFVDESKSTFDHLIPGHHIEHIPLMRDKPQIQWARCWGYNGTTPGPVIEVTQGDRIRVRLKNELPEPTTIHWNGLEVPNDQDSAPFIYSPVMPGESRTYEFTVYQAGSFIYQSGFNMFKQVSMGLVGFLVSHPREYERKIDRQFVLMLQAWMIRPGNKDLDLFSDQTMWFTCNGVAAPNIPVLEVQEGEKVRMRFVTWLTNADPIHLHGHTWQEVINEKVMPKKSSTIFVTAGGTHDVEFIAWNPGIWPLYSQRFHQTLNFVTDLPFGILKPGGIYTVLCVKAKDPDKKWQHPSTAEFET